MKTITLTTIIIVMSMMTSTVLFAQKNNDNMHLQELVIDQKIVDAYIKGDCMNKDVQTSIHNYFNTIYNKEEISQLDYRTLNIISKILSSINEDNTISIEMDEFQNLIMNFNALLSAQCSSVAVLK